MNALFTVPAPVFALESASSISRGVDVLFIALMFTSALMTGVLFIGVSWYLWRYRKGSKADRSEARFEKHSHKVEIGWITALTVIFLGIGIWGALAYIRMARPPVDKETLEVYVTGRQWMWDILQPGGRREHNELHVPVGRAVRLVMTSEDVIHSFYVPDFRLKHDVMPGRYTSLWFKATKTGEYPLYCAEFCGTGHSVMTGKVIVMEPEAYTRWAQQGDQQEALVASGKRLFNHYGCSGCHSEGSQIHAPLLDGLYGRPVALAEGGFVMADEAYLHDSIRLPEKHIAAGYEAIMPTYDNLIPPDELFAIVAYIKSLAGPDSVPEDAPLK